MHWGLIKLVFDPDCFPEEGWRREAGNLCLSLRSRFKVVAKPCQPENGELAIAVVTLDKSDMVISQRFDKIIAFAESYGLGRLLNEERYISSLEELSYGD